MAERFLFFNAMEIEPGVWDREYQAQHFAEYFGSVLSTGLLHTDKVPGMGVAVEVGTLNTVVSAGKSIMKGHLYENTTPLTLAHSIPEPNLDRIDRVVLRLNLNNSVREIRLRVLEGESSANPTAPDLVRTQFIHDISLAQVRVRANTSSLDPLDLVDERMIEDLCGLVYSLMSIPTTVFQQQWDTWFETQKLYYQENVEDWTDEQQTDFLEWRQQEEALFNLWMDEEKQDFYDWVATLEGILSGDVAGNLLQMIDANKAILDTRGLANGLAELDGNGTVPIEQLPSLDFVPTSEKSGFVAYMEPGTFKWTCPEGLTKIFVTAVGGGGGGGSSEPRTNTPNPGGGGGATSFDSLLTVSGGGGGAVGASYAVGGVGGGNKGTDGVRGGGSGTDLGFGGASLFGDGAKGTASNQPGPYFGGGGNGSFNQRSNGDYYCGGGGGGGGTQLAIVNVVPGTQYVITVGAGGRGVAGYIPSASYNIDGADGFLTIEYIRE